MTEAAPDASLKKDQNRLLDVAKPAAPKPDPAAAPKRTGQIAVFISRKDAKLYVRQNFAPLFEAPITIAPGDRPLGTHVFTARVDKDDSNLLHWSVVSLPVPARYALRRDEDERVSRRRKVAAKMLTWRNGLTCTTILSSRPGRAAGSARSSWTHRSTSGTNQAT